MKLRLTKLWAWPADGEGAFVAADVTGDVVLAYSWDQGVTALRVRREGPQVLWRHPATDNVRGGVDAAALRPAGPGVAESLLLVIRQPDQGPAVRCLRLADGSVAWEKRFNAGGVEALAAGGDFAYVRHVSGMDRRIVALEAERGGEVTALHVAERVHSLVIADDADARVLFATGQAVSQWDVSDAREHVLLELPDEEPARRDVYDLISVGHRVFGAAGYTTLFALDRSTNPPRLLWKTRCPGSVSKVVYDARLDLLASCGSGGEVTCVNGSDGSVRWTARCLNRSSSILTGAGAFLHTPFGPLLAFPGVDEALYLADALTGEVLDRVQFGHPLEVQVRALADEPVVVVPFGAVSALKVVPG